ncbi:MAG: oxygen-dependent protoporphyrinogen oxidase [Myxococcota bacterium]|jgi:oxygen-dependent protoporphyrinogen oxidase
MGRRLVIVGAGISGLAAAQSAAETRTELGLDVDIVVVERAKRVGGKAQTVRRDGWLVETGPTGYLDNEPLMDRLVAAAGLEKIVANAAAAHRFVVRDARMRELHAQPGRFLTSGVLGPLGVLRLATEPFRRKLTDAHGETVDESVWRFAERRLGRQAADRLIAPMVLGVFAGDAKQLSLPAAFPRMAELEQEYGSLVKALRALKKARGEDMGGPAGPSGKLTSFGNGLNTLPSRLASRGVARGHFAVQTDTTVTALSHNGARWVLGLEQDGAQTAHLEADAVVLAGEVFSTAKLLRPVLAAVSETLDVTPTPAVSVVGLGYGPEVLAKAPRGFGALIQRGQALRILGVLWDTHLFPHRSADGTLLMRCMVGGAVDPDAAALTDAQLVDLCQRDVALLLGLEGKDAEPIFTEVARWPRAIPQYTLGHLDRMRHVREAVATSNSSRPGLHLAGNYLTGVAFTKAARCGWEAGAAAAIDVAGRALVLRR